MFFLVGIPIILIVVFATQLMFILNCDYIDLKTMLKLLSLHVLGTSISILAENSSIIIQCLTFLVTVIVIYSSSILTRNHYKELKKTKTLILSGLFLFFKI